MQENTGKGGLVDNHTYQKRCSQIPFSKIANTFYRCLVAAGVIVVIFMLIKLQQKQFLIQDIVSNATFNIRRPQEEYKDFVVYNPSCEIPNYPKFHEDVRPYYRKMPPINCSSKPLLTSISHHLDSNFTYVLNLHRGFEAHYLKNGSKLVCCYSMIKTNNINYTISDCQQFETNVTLVATADLVHVNCRDDNNATVYKINHFLVPIKDLVRQKMERADSSSSEEQMSVMILGLDGVSKLNLLRTMPATVDYLDNNRWFSFAAYHRIQLNTFYNLIGPVLTGDLGRHLYQNCWPDESNHLDSCPYIWKNYSARNYITAYGEDSPSQDSFTQQGYDGFKNQPTDYYLKPHMTVTEMVTGELTQEAEPKCIGPIKAADYILNFAADFASTFVQYPTFSLFWLNTGHNDLNAPQILDERFIEYFGHLNSSGVLNRTMVVFMSDHGFRNSYFRTTYMGFMEAAMPFLYIWLPKWFRDKHPAKIENMERNKYRLASHFDLHLTLMDVLGVKAMAEGCLTCVSLFDPLPWNRGCSDAGIGLESCACDNFESIPIDATVRKLAEQVAAYINARAASFTRFLKKGYKCSNVTVKSIETARRDVLKKQEFGQKYVIHVVTSPRNVPWEAFVLSHTLEVVSITEYTPYGPRSKCMKIHHGKKWCICEHL